MPDKRVSRLAVLLVIGLLAAPTASAQTPNPPGSDGASVDPLALQARAVRRLDDFVANFRRTGDFQSRLPDLAQADTELSSSNRALAARGDWSALATGLIKQGSVRRIQGDSGHRRSRSTNRRPLPRSAETASASTPTPWHGARSPSHRAPTAISDRRQPTRPEPCALPNRAVTTTCWRGRSTCSASSNWRNWIDRRRSNVQS